MGLMLGPVPGVLSSARAWAPATFWWVQRLWVFFFIMPRFPPFSAGRVCVQHGIKHAGCAASGEKPPRLPEPQSPRL